MKKIINYIDTGSRCERSYCSLPGNSNRSAKQKNFISEFLVLNAAFEYTKNVNGQDFNKFLKELEKRDTNDEREQAIYILRAFACPQTAEERL